MAEDSTRSAQVVVMLLSFKHKKGTRKGRRKKRKKRKKKKRNKRKES
jgi:hypothetical protein